MADKMKKAQFDFEDYLDSMEQMRKMGRFVQHHGNAAWNG